MVEKNILGIASQLVGLVEDTIEDDWEPSQRRKKLKQVFFDTLMKVQDIEEGRLLRLMDAYKQLELELKAEKNRNMRATTHEC